MQRGILPKLTLRQGVDNPSVHAGVVLWLVLWLVIFAPLYCYRHGLLIFHSASAHENRSAHFEDYICGEDYVPDPHAHAEATHHSTASQSLLISSAMILLPPTTHIITRNNTLITRLLPYTASLRSVYLPKLKTPPRLAA